MFRSYSGAHRDHIWCVLESLGHFQDCHPNFPATFMTWRWRQRQYPHSNPDHYSNRQEPRHETSGSQTWIGAILSDCLEKEGAVKKSADATPHLKFIIAVTIVAIAMVMLSLAMGIPPPEEAPILHAAP
jgi:hypothetical protein